MAGDAVDYMGLQSEGDGHAAAKGSKKPPIELSEEDFRLFLQFRMHQAAATVPAPLAIPQPAAHPGGFGSPIPAMPQSQPQPVSRLKAANAQNKVGAQLTIFYAGTVNVYDNVPQDKARAIMLLAGSGSTYRMSTTGGAALPLIPSSKPSSLSSPSSPAPTSPRPYIAELPQARKASLARFLDKRKDRGRAKAPYALPADTKPPPHKTMSSNSHEAARPSDSDHATSTGSRGRCSSITECATAGNEGGDNPLLQPQQVKIH